MSQDQKIEVIVPEDQLMARIDEPLPLSCIALILCITTHSFTDMPPAIDKSGGQ